MKTCLPVGSGTYNSESLPVPFLKSLALVQDPVTGQPAMLTKLYNVTQQKQMEAELQTQKEALARCASTS